MRLSPRQGFLVPLKGYKIPIRGYYTCNSESVVHSLKCPCGMIYVRQTSRLVRNREHKYSISTYDPHKKKIHSPVGKHFYLNKHSLATLRWMLLEEINIPHRGGHKKCLLLQREAW
ncbi:hypothetical protein XELAEV_18047421mg [Xenopus laevis]|uniref:Uncharacterized protein n=1 Tax=Xenopus laevis TaxID=8355 RepID=A0A974H1J5_XENLA|nr:hypothetical protein XELAEV_18047421mg [Xenopus laevis]